MNTTWKTTRTTAERFSPALEEMSAVLGSMGNGLFATDAQGLIIHVNETMLHLLGRLDEGLVGHPVEELFGAGLDALLDRAGLALPTSGLAIEGRGCLCECLVPGKDGCKLPVEISLGVVDVDGQAHVVGVVRDVTRRHDAEKDLRQTRDDLEERVRERTEELSKANKNLRNRITRGKKTEAALREAERKYRSIFEHSMDGILQLDASGNYIDANPSAARVFGYSTPDELLTALRGKDVSPYEDVDRDKDFFHVLRRRGEEREFISRVVRPDGEKIWVSQSGRAAVDDKGEVLFYECMVEDITERKKTESRLLHQAFHDPLTGLPNRTLFLEHLQNAAERKKRSPSYLFAVLMLDLDRFKVINDSLGHAIGDELLKHVAEMLLESVRTVDTVARFGGDEFAVLLENIAAPREGIKVTKRIQTTIATPAVLGGYDVRTAASIGIVIVSEPYEEAELILRDADTAMYHAKESGRGRFKVFNQQMHEQAVRLLELETELRKAIERDQFMVFYQPILNLNTGQLRGFEALMRWEHHEHGLISPAEFIPLAEDTGLIFPLGEWILRHVCQTIHRWGQTYGQDAPIQVSVNLSSKQFMRPDIHDSVQKLLTETGIDPKHLVLEISENTLMSRAENSAEHLVNLKKIGVGLSMDDFGTGYSSVSYLREFPIDTIKIDRSFISTFGDDDEARAIVNSMVSLSKNLGISLVAEGVDTDVQLEQLRVLECEYAQGYLFSRPVPEQEAEELIRSGEPLIS